MEWRMGRRFAFVPRENRNPPRIKVRGRLFPDHALVQPPMDLTFNIELRPVGDDDDTGGG